MLRGISPESFQAAGEYRGNIGGIERVVFSKNTVYSFPATSHIRKAILPDLRLIKS